MKIAADTDICMYLETHAHVHQIMFTDALSCIYLYYNVVLLLQCYVSCCSNTAVINNPSQSNF